MVQRGQWSKEANGTEASGPRRPMIQIGQGYKEANGAKMLMVQRGHRSKEANGPCKLIVQGGQ